MSFANGRLPTIVKPIAYDIEILADLSEFTFRGSVRIRLAIRQTTSKITFHSSDLHLESPRVIVTTDKAAYEVAINNIVHDKKKELVNLHLSTEVPSGATAELSVDFHRALAQGQAGFTWSKLDLEGKPQFYAFTQLAPIQARRVFPCWDEPAMKARFSIALITDANNVNLSNMPVLSEEPYVVQGSGVSWKRTQFETTPPMSTYIVAFATGPFAYLETSYKSPLSGTAQYSLDVAEAVLPIYERAFDVEYPLPKFDTLIVNGFDAGAVENWGLIMGSPVSFLLDDLNNLAGKRLVAKTQTHETGHMWFGNITTTAWWDTVYLNEGQVILPLLLTLIHPEWDEDQMFILERLQGGMASDALLSAHPIEWKDFNIDNVMEIFDSLSYSKGASVLRMLSTHVGEDKFLQGVSKYLQDHRYGSTVSKDLWDSLAAIVGHDISALMDSWVTRVGFPVINVSEKDGVVQVRQDRFMESGRQTPGQNETIWHVPLSILSLPKEGGVRVDHNTVLTEREMTLSLDPAIPFKLNANTTGFYRVLYSGKIAENVAKLVAQKGSPLSVADRIGLVLDALALAKAGFSNVSDALSFLDHFRREENALVWSSIAGGLNAIANTWWEHERIQDYLGSFQRELFSPLVERLGFEYPQNEPDNTKILRTCAIAQAALSGDKNVIEELKQRFANFIKTGDESVIPSDLRALSFRIANQYGTQEDYLFLKETALASKIESIRIAALIALGASPDMSFAEETWDMIMSSGLGTDIIYLCVGLRDNYKTRRFLANKFRENYDALAAKLYGNYSWQPLISYSHEQLSTKEDYQTAKEFFKTKDMSMYTMTVEQILESIISRADWIERSTSELLSWLEKRTPPEISSGPSGSDGQKRSWGCLVA
ncbi:peptidase family M1-domain-containing protein [Cristinia sonorae]|uniref:Aminopeptidase n=1 Tax=Cristinia sonorae TaxID=1940300 RepID=A0A8K0UHZ6_9AGAR|nr:peptidase family M1-domain-containing protein [Cristinia sonorae]